VRVPVRGCDPSFVGLMPSGSDAWFAAAADAADAEQVPPSQLHAASRLHCSALV
tara:strand:+ start:895 stop:1056 length:162 start_codon:yes stop_codon:yes gene_type:complete